MAKLFRKNIEKSCGYCRYGKTMGEDKIACIHQGVMDAQEHCRRFSYDPFKRVPPRPAAPEMQKHSSEEFSI